MYQARLFIQKHKLSETSLRLAAHHQVPSRLEGQQEAHAAAPRDGEVSPVSDSGWDPLPSCQLGAPQGSGEQLYWLQRSSFPLHTHTPP